MNITSGGMNTSFNSGFVIPLLLMFPNIIWMLLPKETTGEQRTAPMALEIVENISRIAALLIPFFYSLNFTGKYSLPVVAAMAIAIVIYYACWIRYFTGGRRQALLAKPFWGIPLPMAVFPIAFLILSSYLLSSWSMFGASLLFGIAHIWVSAISL